MILRDTECLGLLYIYPPPPPLPPDASPPKQAIHRDNAAAATTADGNDQPRHLTCWHSESNPVDDERKNSIASPPSS